MLDRRNLNTIVVIIILLLIIGGCSSFKGATKADQAEENRMTPEESVANELITADVVNGEGLNEAMVEALTEVVAGEEVNLPLQSGDKLDIFVWDSPELSQQVVISPNGYFSYPILKQIKAQGLTITQLQEKMEKLLSDGYLVNPIVKITVLQRKARHFYVFGEVEKPQRIEYPTGENITVLKAVTMAGGLTDKASQQRIRIIRKGDGERKEISVSLYDDVMPGDIVIVPQALF